MEMSSFGWEWALRAAAFWMSSSFRPGAPESYTPWRLRLKMIYQLNALGDLEVHRRTAFLPDAVGGYAAISNGRMRGRFLFLACHKS